MVAGVVQLGLREDTDGRHPGPASHLGHGEASEVASCTVVPERGQAQSRGPESPGGSLMGPEGVKRVPASSFSLISFPDKQCAVMEKEKAGKGSLGTFCEGKVGCFHNSQGRGHRRRKVFSAPFGRKPSPARSTFIERS